MTPSKHRLKRGGATMEYIIITAAAIVISVSAAKYLKQLAKDQIESMEDTFSSTDF